MPSAKVNRILISAPASNSGKTTVACAILQALKNRGFELTACKSGPDYIDPMFHSKVIGAQSRNLDLFFSSEDEIRELVGKGTGDNRITVIEGAMGY